MIYITSDTHGDFKKLGPDAWPEGAGLTKDDHVIVLGDFGLNLEEPDGDFEYWRKWMCDLPFTTLWIDGNHDNWDWLDSLETVDWHGGKAKLCSDDGSIVYLQRGEVYDIDGESFLAFGGTYCGGCATGMHDCPHEKNMLPAWHDRAVPTEEDFERACANLAARDWHVDYVLAHGVPTHVQQMLMGCWMQLDSSGAHHDFLRASMVPNVTTEMTERLASKLDFKIWYSGHYHFDAVFDERYALVYREHPKAGELPRGLAALLGRQVKAEDFE